MLRSSARCSACRSDFIALALADDFFKREKPQPDQEPPQAIAMRELRGYLAQHAERRSQPVTI
jgi:hypothetical protein